MAGKNILAVALLHLIVGFCKPAIKTWSSDVYHGVKIRWVAL